MTQIDDIYGGGGGGGGGQIIDRCRDSAWRNYIPTEAHYEDNITSPFHSRPAHAQHPLSLHLVWGHSYLVLKLQRLYESTNEPSESM